MNENFKNDSLQLSAMFYQHRVLLLKPGNPLFFVIKLKNRILLQAKSALKLIRVHSYVVSQPG